MNHGGILATGTLMKTTIPVVLRVPNVLTRADLCQSIISVEEISVCNWFDFQIVSMASTEHKVEPVNV